jgi:hypothetical protein
MFKALLWSNSFKSRRAFIISLTFLFVIFVTVFGTNKLLFSGSKIQNHTPSDKHKAYVRFADKLYRSMNTKGKTFIITKGGNNNIFRMESHDLHINNHIISIYEFKSREEVNEHVKKVSIDGKNIDDFGIVEWAGQPHFFRKDNLIILYVGNDGEILSALQKVAGDQFAGSPI